MIAVFCALKEELKGLLKRMQINKTFIFGKCCIYEASYGREKVLLVLTGMGKKLAEKAVELVLTMYPVSKIIITGFGGALNPRFESGDIIIYSGLICGDSTGRDPGSEKKLYPDPAMVSVVSQLPETNGFRLFLGKGVTITNVCTLPDSKYRMGNEYAADAVDMESYWIGHTATERNLPFLAARSIIDSVQDDLSLINKITVNGRFAPVRACRYFISHPGDLKKTAVYYQKSKKARRNLSIFLLEFIERA